MWPHLKLVGSSLVVFSIAVGCTPRKATPECGPNWEGDREAEIHEQHEVLLDSMLKRSLAAYAKSTSPDLSADERRYAELELQDVMVQIKWWYEHGGYDFLSGERAASTTEPSQ
jgi:hypothetical protein